MTDREVITIREELPADAPAVAALNRFAFNGDFEAGLVGRLHADGLVVASLLATDGAGLVGHVLFSTLVAEVDGKPLEAVALAPMAVHPGRQRQGIGSQLVRAGLATVKARGRSVVIVLGHASYYPRFGFSAALARKLRSPFSGEQFMALEIEAGALAGAAGSVRYPPAFGLA